MALKPSKTDKKTDAKASKEDKASKTTAKEKAPKAETKEFKYGVADLQKLLGHGDPASTRVALRKHEIEKAGKSYGWDSKDELEKIAAKIKAGTGGDKETKAKPDKKAPAKDDKKASAKKK